MTTPSQTYMEWIKDASLPFWTQHAWDPRHGGWFERLDREGEPENQAPRRTRVQSRQVIALCQAAHLGWSPSEYTQRALETMEWWWQKSWAKDGLPGLCHQLDAETHPLQPKRDAYDHAFALLALSWAFSRTGDTQVLGMMNQVFDFLDEFMLHPNGGLVEECSPVNHGAGKQSLEPLVHSRRQNPHMHLFEAATAAFQTLQENNRDTGRAKRWLNECLALFDQFFHDSTNGQIIEHFDGDWTPKQDPVNRRVEPGHGAEWVWLLHDARERAADGIDVWPNFDAENLNDVAMSQGFDYESGLMVNWYDPVTKTASTAARSWPTMEMVRAGIAMGADEQVERGCEALIQSFNLDNSVTNRLGHSLFGGWCDSVDIKGGSADGETLAGGASSMQTSTLYHVTGVAMALNWR